MHWFNKIFAGITTYMGWRLLVMAVLTVVALFVWLYKVIVGSDDFTWGTFIGLTVIVAVLFSIGYSLYRIGSEEMED
jgi:hypothetical protein